jgi:nicotinate-nucleotide pyrophosphorylase (carboxylating)
MHAIENLIQLALEEDIGLGDITTDNLPNPNVAAQGVIIAKEPLTICGLDIAQRVFRRLDRNFRFQLRFADGDAVAKGDTVMKITGPLAALLKGERTALNFVQRLSGIATLTRTYIAEIENTKTQVVDTRKTTPGWRVLEKYAVRCGGARNHRMGLFDGVLIKDNHITACGGIRKAVQQIRTRVSHLVKIEVETADMDQVLEALTAKVDVIMLDNMDGDQIKEAVTAIAGRALVEVSGNVTLANLRELAQSGVDLISVGALTHSARAVDLSMQIEIV